MASNSILDLLNKWNIRGFILLSLSLQFLLFLFAPLRKKTTNERIIFFLWLAYLMADWVATFTIGLISHNQGNSCARADELDGALQALWASFLLLHLGGPDTITAFSTEDTLLWRRHLLSLIIQFSATIYVFVHIFPSDKSLVSPSILVFLAGVIKNAERTWSLFSPSFMLLDKTTNMWGGNSLIYFREELDLGDGYFEEEEEEEAKLPESIVVRHAYLFYRISIDFFGDHMFTCIDREICREYFHKVSAMDVFRVISVELHFIYEVIYTKAIVIYCPWSHIFRFIAFIDIAMAFVLFNRLKKHQIPKLDVEVTYSLFLGGIAFDMITPFMVVFSDWTVAIIERRKWHDKKPSKLDSYLNKLVSAIYDLRKPLFATSEVKPNTNVLYAILDKLLIFQRWSESTSACNLLSEILKESPGKMYTRDRLKDSPRKMYKCDWCLGTISFSNLYSFLFCMPKKIISCFRQAGEAIIQYCTLNVRMKYVSKNPLIKNLWIFIFKEVKRKAKNANRQKEVRKIFEARGDMFLESRPSNIHCGNLLMHVTEATYDASVMVWHLATEMWYNRETVIAKNDEREFSKILSDYMLYLLINQSNVMSNVTGIIQERLGDTLDELGHIISHAASNDVEGACMELFKRGGEPRDFSYPNSAVFEGIKLAMEMESLGEKKWEVMSGVWVEMLSYAAVHTNGTAHAQVLSRGGELLTFVWLLMVHFGCFYKPGLGMYYGNSC